MPVDTRYLIAGLDALDIEVAGDGLALTVNCNDRLGRNPVGKFQQLNRAHAYSGFRGTIRGYNHLAS